MNNAAGAQTIHRLKMKVAHWSVTFSCYFRDFGHTVKIAVSTGKNNFVPICAWFLKSTNQSQVFSTNVSIKEHKELLCPKRIVC